MGFIKFIKTYTLPCAMFIGAIVYLIFAFTPSLSSVATFFAPHFNRILPLFTFLVLFVTFCKVDFRKLRVVRWHIYAIAIQFVFVAIIVTIILSFASNIKTLIFFEALLLCIIGPCATAAPVVTQKLGGNIEEMTTYTFLSNFVTSLLIPVCFPLIDNTLNISFISAFSKMSYQVFFVLVMPMIVAYVVKHYVKTLHAIIVRQKDLSYYLWAINLIIVSGTTIKNIVHAKASVAFLCLIAIGVLVFCVVQFKTGRVMGSKFKRTLEAGQALGQKNTAFAIWIANVYLNPLSSVGPGCYILWQNIINSIEIARFGKTK